MHRGGVQKDWGEGRGGCLLVRGWAGGAAVPEAWGMRACGGRIDGAVGEMESQTRRFGTRREQGGVAMRGRRER